MDEMRGKVCLVTGATSGIGKVAALELAKRGATLVVTARDAARGEATAAEIRAQSHNPAVALLLVDFGSQRSIRALAAAFRARYKQLHVLINNAGAIYGARTLSEDGLELTFAVNHIGYFLLTNLLLDMIKSSAPARIINVSSDAHRRARLDLSDLQLERGYSGLLAYSNSKLANILFTSELARRLQGSGVTVNAVHPGAVRTRWGDSGSALFRGAIRLARPFMLTSEQGAETLVYLATDPVGAQETGKYWAKKRVSTPTRQAQDPAAAARLWQASAALTGLPG